MRYRAYFLEASDAAIHSAPRAITVNVKKKYVNFEFMLKVPMDRVESMSMEYESSDKAFSVAKAGVGLLIAGPVGLAGGALGGKKTKLILTINYVSDNGQNVYIKLEGNTTAMIKNKYDKILSKNSK